jgi:CheY-like chemotaxis protein
MPKVLIVDENQIRREMFVSMARSLGYAVIQAETGADCIQKALSEHADLIIMQLMLPVMSGAEVTAWLKSNPFTRDIPVVIYAPRDAIELRNDALRNGAAEVLSEPILTDSPADVLRKYLAGATGH